MPKALRVIFPILLLAAVYCGWYLSDALFPDSTNGALGVWTAAVFITGALNVASACMTRGNGSPRKLAFWDMLLKLCFIPFYVVVFSFALGSTLAFMVVPGTIFFAPVVMVALVVVDYVLLLFTSSYGIAGAIRGQKQGMLTVGMTVVLCVLHFIFVTDVIASIVLYVQIRKASKRMTTF